MPSCEVPGEKELDVEELVWGMKNSVAYRWGPLSFEAKMALVGPCKKQWLNRIWVCMPGGNCRERGHYYGHAGGDGTRWRLRYGPLEAIWRLAVPLFCRTDNEVESSPRFHANHGVYTTIVAVAVVCLTPGVAHKFPMGSQSV